MSDVRMQPKSMPRSTSIARTTVSSSRPSGVGSSIASSPAASPAARQHAAQSMARQPQAPRPRVGGLDALATPELQFLFSMVDGMVGRITDAARDPSSDEEKRTQAAKAYETANKILDKIGTELRARPE